MDASKCVLIQMIRASKSRVNSLRQICVKPFGYISTSMDKMVKIWTELGELCGEINLGKEITRLEKWKFKFDWEAQHLNDIDRVKQIFKDINLIEQRQLA